MTWRRTQHAFAEPGVQARARDLAATVLDPELPHVTIEDLGILRDVTEDDHRRLAEAAARHACDMAQRGRMTHIGSATPGPAPRVKAITWSMIRSSWVAMPVKLFSRSIVSASET